MKICDKTLPKSNYSMSNFDHSIDEGMEEDLRNGMRSYHAGWNFFGLVWFESGQFHEMVKQYRHHIATHSADSLRELMVDVNASFGDQ